MEYKKRRKRRKFIEEFRREAIELEVIFHSDGGSQYASSTYRKILRSKSLKPSMPRRGNGYDNAYVKSWFDLLKKGWKYRHQSNTATELRTLVFEFIETWYN